MSEFRRGFLWGAGGGVFVALWVGGREPFLVAVGNAITIVLVVLALDWLKTRVRP